MVHRQCRQHGIADLRQADFQLPVPQVGKAGANGHGDHGAQEPGGSEALVERHAVRHEADQGADADEGGGGCHGALESVHGSVVER